MRLISGCMSSVSSVNFFNKPHTERTSQLSLFLLNYITLILERKDKVMRSSEWKRGVEV